VICDVVGKNRRGRRGGEKPTKRPHHVFVGSRGWKKRRRDEGEEDEEEVSAPAGQPAGEKSKEKEKADCGLRREPT